MLNVPLYVNTQDELPLAYEIALIVSQGGLKDLLQAYKSSKKKEAVEPPVPVKDPAPEISVPVKSPPLNLYKIVEEVCSCFECYDNFAHNTRMKWKAKIKVTTKNDQYAPTVTCRHSRKGQFKPCLPVTKAIAWDSYQSDSNALDFGNYSKVETCGYIYDLEKRGCFKDTKIKPKEVTRSEQLKIAKIQQEANTSIQIAQMQIEARQNEKRKEREDRANLQQVKEDAEEVARAKLCNDQIRVKCGFCGRYKTSEAKQARGRYCCHREEERARQEGETSWM
jgi:hypothetical protein